MSGDNVKKIDMTPNTTYMIIDAGGAYIYIIKGTYFEVTRI